MSGRDLQDQHESTGATLIVLPEEGIVGEPRRAVNPFFNPEVQDRAVHYQERTAESGPQTADVGGSNTTFFWWT